MQVFSSGPYCLAFACLCHYLLEVPSVSRLRLGGAVRLSEKSLLYLTAAYLALGMTGSHHLSIRPSLHSCLKSNAVCVCVCVCDHQSPFSLSFGLCVLTSAIGIIHFLLHAPSVRARVYTDVSILAFALIAYELESLARGRTSLLPSLLGVLVGSLHARLGFFRRLAVPKFIASIFGATLGRIISLGSPSSNGDASGREWPTRGGPVTGQEGVRGDDDNRRANAGGIPTYAAMAAEPSEENVARLEAMGFARDQCVAALRRCGNDIAAAAEMLLSQL